MCDGGWIIIEGVKGKLFFGVESLSRGGKSKMMLKRQVDEELIRV